MKWSISVSIFGFFLIQKAYLSDSIKLILFKDKDQDYLTEWIKESAVSDEETVLVDLDDEAENEKTICDNLENGGTMFIDFTWMGNAKAKEISANFQIPYFHVDISISPFLELLDEYLGYRNSTDVAIIFDNPKKMDEALYFWIDTTLLRMVISENLDSLSARKLGSIKPIPNNFAVIAETSNMTNIVKTALTSKIVTLPQRWNLLFLDFEQNTFDHQLLQGLPVNLMYLDKEMCCKFLGKDDDCTCPKKFNLQQHFFHYVMDLLRNVITILKNENFEFTNNLKCDTNDVMYNEQTKLRFSELLNKELEDTGLIHMNEKLSIRISINGTIEIESNDTAFDSNVVAKYDYKNGITKIEGKSIPSIKPFYRVGITHALPWSFKEKDSKGNEYWTGYCADFTRKLAEEMHFDFEFVEPKTGTFGKKKNGVWNGVIGDLATGETDISVTSLIMTADREEVVDFVAPYFEQTGITIVMRKPVRKTSLFKFMTVLKLEVWLSIVGALIVTGFMVWFLDKYSPYSARNNKKAYPYPCREFTLKESFWFALTSFTPQGGGEAPKALSGRTLVAAYWLFVVLMLATFTANLAAFLTVERMQTPVQSLEQLAKQSRINYTVVKDSDTHIYFINMKNAEDTLYRMWKELTLNASTDETQYRVWDYPIREQYGHILLAINDSDPVADATQGFAIVNERTDADYAFIHDSSEIKYEITRNCNLTEVGEVFAEKPYAVAVQQGSHLQDEISKTILNLQKDRFFEQLQSRYWNHSSKGSCPNTDDNEGITLESLGGVFIATLFGLALAMITLVGEVLYYRKKRKDEAGPENTKGGNKFVGNEPKMAPKMASKMASKHQEKTPITIGTEFRPVNYRDKKISDLTHISLYPRSRNNRITLID